MLRNQRTFLVVLGLVCHAAAAPAAVQTNDVQKKALDLLRQTMDNLERNPGTPAKQTAAPSPGPSFADAERLYLQGKITAKEFQQYLENQKLDPAKLKAVDNQKRALEVLHQEMKKPEPAPSKPALPPPAVAQEVIETAPPAEGQSSLNELEKKMDELIRLKEAREKVAPTNVVPTAVTNAPPAAAAPRTKRERLDELLKLVIDGKLSDAEYKEKRAKIVAEPD